MGCFCVKPMAVKDSRESPIERLPRKGSWNSHVPRINSTRGEEIVRPKDKLDNGDVKFMLIDKKRTSSLRIYDDQIEKKGLDKCEVPIIDHPGLGRVPKATAGEQVAAGWPSWLAAVAGEAINGWVPRQANTFARLDKIGQGTYSTVYKARDIIHNKLVALKKVRFDTHDPESIKFMAREILLLRRLDHPNIIKLESLITSPASCSLYLVFEYMEHDLVGLASLPGIKFSEPQVKCYMQQLLSGLDHCHSRGVLHRDIKGSNLLIDSNGILKIADFGLASFFYPRNPTPMTSRVVTLWYRPPELLLGASHYGVAVDLWSTGCILGELYSNQPILPGKTEVEQLHKIFKLCGSPSEDYWRKSKLPHSTAFKPIQPYRRCVAETFKDFPAPVVRLLETLLSFDPIDRGTAALALQSEFFTTRPLACNPSSLPKYPPSKEINAKLRDEEARRQGAVRGRDQRVNPEWRGGPIDYTAVQVPNANTELAAQGKVHANSKSRRDLSYPLPRDFSERSHKKVSHSGPLVHVSGWTNTRKEPDDIPVAAARTNLSNLSGLVATRTSVHEDRREPKTSFPEEFREKHGPSRTDSANLVRRFQGSCERDSAEKQEHVRHTQRISDSPHARVRRAHANEPSLPGRGPRGNKIYLSGPLLVPSNNVDQMLKEHDRRIQEYARRARLDRAKPGKAHGQERHATEKSASSRRRAG